MQASNPETQKRLTELAAGAQASLTGLLEFEAIKREQWLMRLTVAGKPGQWEALTADTSENDRLIRERVAQSEKPVTELALGFVGTLDWRGKKRFMAYVQYFRADSPQGLLCLRYLKEAPEAEKVEALGAFIIAGVCQNTWL